MNVHSVLTPLAAAASAVSTAIRAGTAMIAMSTGPSMSITDL